MLNHETSRDRIAIIGIGLTLPGGATDQDSFWNLLAQKKDATIDIPEDRWDARRFYSPYGSEKPGKMYVTRGGFLEGKAGEFDPLFFGISPREASVMDFQQRLLLEVAAKTFQDAGFTEQQYEKKNVGVFIGGFCMDASIQAASIHNRNWCITQSVTGSTATLLSNRISYIFDLKGPSLTVDTACSSSLVAAHYAVESILSGECETALVGGVNAMTQPEHFIEMCKSKLLSKDGRCFTWDKRANGYARGEGAGMVLLKSLAAAQRDNDHIYAVIEASGVNQDGTTKGITLPNPEAQTNLINRVLKKAGITPADIDYVEAHGTGTQAGDKAETSALNNVFAQGRDDKLVIGSVKTNIGHLEAAAGVSGLIKAVLCLKNGKIPANLNFETPNPDIPFDTMCLKVPTEMQDWPRKNKIKYVGVNAFGYGGTNAHIVLSEAPATQTIISEVQNNLEVGPLLLPLSAQSQYSLDAVAEQYKTLIEQNKIPIDQFLRRISTKRNHYNRRVFIHAPNKEALLEKLEFFTKGIFADGIISVDASAGTDKLVFVYSGMGPQWWGMGRELLIKEPLFKQKIEEYDHIFKKISGWSLLDEMQVSEEESRMAKTDVAQPMNFAIQAALTELWRAWGIVPAAVVGHSVGEVTSAYISGILSLEDALQVSYHRSRLQGTLAGTGGMLAVGLSEKAIQPYVEAYSDQVSVAAVNSPGAVTLAGEQAALDLLANIFQQENIFNRALQVEVPYHSPLMSPIEADIKTCLANVKPQIASIPCYSTVTGKLAEGNDYDANYWWHNVRDAVLFAKAIGTLCDDGFQCFLEVGPHPVLTNSMKEILSEKDVSGQVYSSLNRKTPEQFTLLNSLGLLYVQGHHLDWKSIHKGEDCYFKLPIYPWQKDSYDHGSPKFYQDKFGESGHPILKRNLQLPHPTWDVELIDSLFPFIKDHKIGQKIILPGAFYVEAALAVNEKVSNERVACLTNLSFERILALPEEKDETEKRIISMYTPETRTFKIFSTTTAREETWAFHMRCELSSLSAYEVDCHPLNQSWADVQAQDINAFYSTIAENGLQYGHYFQPIKTLKGRGDKVYAELENTLSDDDGYILPPPILDGIFQTLFVFGGKYRVPFIPVKIDQLTLSGKVTKNCSVIGKLLWMSAKSLKADFVLFDENNHSIAEIKGVTCQALAQMGASDQDQANMYHTSWEILDVDQIEIREQSNETFLIISSATVESNKLVDQISYRSNNNTHFINVNEWSATNFEDLLKVQSVDKVIYVCDQIVNLENALENAVSQCARITKIVKILNETTLNNSVELLLCTRQASKVLDSDTVEGVAFSSLIGFGRTINTEYPKIKCSVIDFANFGDHEVEKFYEYVICGEMGINELAIRGNRIFQHALVVLEQEENSIETTNSIIGQRITVNDFSALEHAQFPFNTAERVLAEGEAQIHEESQILQQNDIELEVDYMTLSYWDQINSQLSIYPDNPKQNFFQYTSGMQCVGTIVKRGSAVTEFSIGDRVLSLYPHGITNFTTIPAHYSVKIPSELQYSSLPDIYEAFRARYAMSVIGTPSKASILIKGIWGAFVQTLLVEIQARDLTAIFVDEANSAIAQRELESIPGVTYLACAESDWVKKISGGIDIFINQGLKNITNLHLLNAFGKIIDFKSSQVQREQSSALPVTNATYHLIDIDFLFMHHFDAVKYEIEKILTDLASEKLVLLPIPSFDLRNIAAAAVELKSGVASAVQVTMQHEAVPLLLDTKNQELVLTGTYVITGGTQGFGLQCAEWLASKGARHLVLISRGGLRSPESSNAVIKLQQKGVNVKICALDINDGNRLNEELSIIKNTMPTICGVIHSAMVLDDAYLAQMDEARFQRVMAPKIQGAINLHLALKDIELDFFLMFSSISSLIGNAGQASYVAANSFLDGFAYYLSSHGIPAKTINWGALSDTGVLVDNASLVKVLELAGIHGVSNSQAMKAMEAVLLGDNIQTGIFNVDWKQWSLTNSALSQSGFYRALSAQQDHSEEHQKLMEILENIITKGQEERKLYIQQELANRFGAIFKMSPEAINPHASIIDLGVDSLVSAEISVALKKQLGVEISAIDLISGPSINQLATKILGQIEALIDEVMNEEMEANGELIEPREESESMAS